MRYCLKVLFASLSLIALTLQAGNPQNPRNSSPKIEVKLIPEKSAISPGETLNLKVEIWNVGADDIFIAQISRHLRQFDSAAVVKVGSKREGPTGLIADSIRNLTRTVEKTVVVTNWLISTSAP